MRVDISKFAGLKDLHRYLIEREQEIYEMKKSFIHPLSGCNKHSDNFDFAGVDQTALKALSTSYKDDVATGVIKRMIIANTYNWMDSHNDVHLDNVFKKSIDERKDKIFHLLDHDFKITAKAGKFINIEEKSVQWDNLGVKKFGYTQALFAETEIKKSYNERGFEAYLNSEVDQHSVGMQYVDIRVAVNDPEYKEAFARWNDNIVKLGNREKAEEVGFFFAVREAKLREISAVLEGSNVLTPTLENKSRAAGEHAEDEPSEQDTLNKRKRIYLINN